MSRYAWEAESKVQSPKSKIEDSESKVQGPRSKAKLYYGLTLVCFALGLMAKPMLVTLPFVLLLMDYWPLGRIYDLRFTIYEPKGLKLAAPVKAPSAPFVLPANRKSYIVYRKLIWEKVPFFVLAVASSVITYVVQKSSGSVSTLESVPFDYRIKNVLVGYLDYVEKMFWPQDMAIMYPLPHDWPMESLMGASFMLAAVTIGALVWARRKPYLAVGWLWFVGTLVPVIGLVRVGAASIADRYTYIPGIGLFIMVAWGVPELLAKWPHGRWILRAAGVAVLASCVAVTALQLKYWKDTMSLYEHALAVTTNNTLAYFSIGGELLLKAQREEAIVSFQKALALDPHHFGANRGMAQALEGQGKTGEAVLYYREALRQKPEESEVLNNMAWIFAANENATLRNGPEAVEYAERACKLTHDEKPIYIGTLAAAYAEAGRFKEAVEAATKAYNLAMTLGMKDLAQRNQELLKLYRASRPFHEAPKEPQVTKAQ